MPKIKQTTPEIPIRTDNLPPIIPNRDNLGLLDNVVYPYKADGTIDWIRLAPQGGLYLKPGKSQEKAEKQYGKPAAELNPFEVEDRYLAVTLNALRHLGRIHGISSLSFTVVVSNVDYSSVICDIIWEPNYVSQGRIIKNSATACASQATTNFMTKDYLVELAANRAEARALRSHLGIAIVSREEILDNGNQPDDSLTINSQNPIDTHKIAAQKLKDAGFPTWKEFNNALLALGYSSYREIVAFRDIPKEQLMTIMGLAAGLQNGTLKPNKDKKE